MNQIIPKEENKTNKKYNRWLVFVLISFALLLILSFQMMPWFFVFLVLLGIIVFLVFYPEYGLYLLIPLAFMHSWEVDFSLYSWARDIPYLPYVNAPVVDIVAIILLIAVCFTWVLKIRKYHWADLKNLLPSFYWYIAFLLVALISVYLAYENNWNLSLKYWLRPMAFVALAFVVLPNLIIERKETFYKVLKIGFWVGFLTALFGFSSLFFGNSGEWLRLVPYGIRGWAPFGYNHNLLAEVLVVLWPLGILFYKKENNSGFLLGSFLMILAAFMTLSRAAWLAIFLSGAILLFYFWKNYQESLKVWFQKQKYLGLILTVIVLVVSLYMLSFLFTSSVVESSTSSRWETIKVVAFYFVRSPLIGYGPGLYMPILNNTAIYIMEYGEALDAHGFIFKIVLEEGLIGLILFGGFLFSVLRRLFKSALVIKNNFGPICVLLVVVGIVCFELFNTSYFNSVMWLPIGLGLASLKWRFDE